MDWMHELCLLLVALVTHVLSASRPHIVFIIADDLGWYDVGFHGSDISTPFIDSLAYRSVILNKYYVNQLSTPTRASILTGRYPIHTGMQHGDIDGATPYGLSLTEAIMPQYFKDLGYKTHMVGKWHLGHYTAAHTPTKRGFDSFFGFYLSHGDYFDHSAEDGDGGYWGYDLRRDLTVQRGFNEIYSTDLFTREAVSIIKDHNASKPLFLLLAHQAVHSGNYNGDPLQAPQMYIRRFGNITNLSRKTFAGMVSALDDSLATVYNALSNKGILNNTIIVFTTDNGGPVNGFDKNAASNWPLRGGKDTVWEGGVRGTAFVFSPLLNTSGYVQENMMHAIDWLSTLYHAAGGNVNRLHNQDGYNMWDMLKTKGLSLRNEILHNIDPIQNFSSLMIGEYKLVIGDISQRKYDLWYPPPGTKLSLFQNSASANRTKPVPGQPIRVECGLKPYDAAFNCQPDKAPCLFHIAADPCEFHNIALGHPWEVKGLISRLEVYRQSMAQPENKPADPRANPALHGGLWGSWMSDPPTKIIHPPTRGFLLGGR